MQTILKLWNDLMFKKKGLAIISLVAVLSLIFLMNYWTSLFDEDDIGFNILEKNNSSAFSNALSFYYGWSGRFIVNSFMFFFMSHDKMLFNLCNAFMYITLCWSMCVLAVGTIKCFDIKMYLLVNLLLWNFLRPWGECILWFVGSFQYLWAVTFGLLFLIPYRLNLEKRSFFNRVITCGMFGFGLVAGCSNETIGAAVLISLSLYVLYNKVKNNTFEMWELMGIFGFLIGFAFLIFAPGNYQRARYCDIVSQGIGEIIIQGFSVCVLKIDRICSVIIGFFALFLSYRHQEKVRKSYFALVCILISLAAHFAMVVSPVFVARSTMATVCFSIIGLCNLITRIDFSQHLVKDNFFKIVCICFTLYFPISMYNAIKDIYVTKQSSDEIIRYILLEKSKGNLNISIKTPLYPEDRHNANNRSYIYADPEKNVTFAQHFSVNSIRGEKL